MAEHDAGLDRHGHMRGWRARRDRIGWDHRPEVAPALRGIVDALGLARYCRRRDCHRRGRCVSPKVDCAWQTLDLMQEHVFPLLRAALRERARDGGDFNGPGAA